MRYVSTTAESSDFPPPPSFLFLLETNCSWDEMMPFYRDARQKYVLQMFNSYSSEFPRLFRLRPGTTWMRSLQRKLWTHRKWSGWLNRTAPSSESAQLVSTWPWSGHQAPDAKTELRSISDTDLLYLHILMYFKVYVCLLIFAQHVRCLVILDRKLMYISWTKNTYRTEFY